MEGDESNILTIQKEEDTKEHSTGVLKEYN